eukprot:Phypoly_transcript_12616.p1 GENE.Phypoly_transcript_12616~~Phypoly_transcript_12616.p1  ORF type:complete len:306 (+),score=36.85 Phypoly_transcript_12616:114-1031(+)
MLIIIPKCIMTNEVSSLKTMCMGLIMREDIFYKGLIPTHLEETLDQMILDEVIERAKLEQGLGSIPGDLWDYNNWWVTKVMGKYEKNYTHGPFDCHHCRFHDEPSPPQWVNLARIFTEIHGEPPTEVFQRDQISPDLVTQYLDWVDKWLEFTQGSREEWEDVCLAREQACEYCHGTGKLSSDEGFHKVTNNWDYYYPNYIFSSKDFDQSLVPEEYKKDESAVIFRANVFLEVLKKKPSITYSMLDEEGWTEMVERRRMWRTPWREASLFFDGNYSDDLLWPYMVFRRLQRAAADGDFVESLICHQ